MKKFLSTIAIAGVATLALASCGGTTDTATKTDGGETTTTSSAKPSGSGQGTTTTTEAPVEKIDPTTYDWDNIQDREIHVWCSENAGVADLFESQINAYLESIGAEDFDVTVEGVGEGVAASNVLKDFTAAADIYCFAQDQLARLVSTNSIVPVSKKVTQTLATEVDDFSVKAATIGNTMYAYPITSDNGYIMFYNKTDMAGVDMTDYEAIIAKCEEKGTKFSWDLKNIWFSAGFFFGAGCVSEWETDDYGEFIHMEDNFAEKGLDSIKAMYKLLSSSAYVNSSSGADFSAANRSSVVITGSWDITTAKGALGDDYAATVLPKIHNEAGEATQIYEFSGCTLMGVKPQVEEDRVLLLQFIANHLAGEECSTARFNQLSWGPSNLASQKNSDVSSVPALQALCTQRDNYSVAQGNIYGSWWTVGNNIATEAAETDGSDEALQAVLDNYETKLKEAFQLRGCSLVGDWNGWGNANPDNVMTYSAADGTYTMTFTIPDTLAGDDDEGNPKNRGGRIIKAGTWETIANVENVDEASQALVDMEKSMANGDKNIYFLEVGTYTLVYDEVAQTIHITKAE
jgi:arabinogalactan oligomer/maltooligosaccharide transport system substrate-binding protein